MKQVENIHTLKRDYPSIFSWFMLERIDTLTKNIDFVLQELRNANGIQSSLTGSLDARHSPWPMLICRLSNNDGRSLTHFSESDHALFDKFTIYLKKQNLNLNGYKNVQSGLLPNKNNIVQRSCLVSPQFNQL